MIVYTGKYSYYIYSLKKNFTTYIHLKKKTQKKHKPSELTGIWQILLKWLTTHCHLKLK